MVMRILLKRRRRLFFKKKLLRQFMMKKYIFFLFFFSFLHSSESYEVLAYYDFKESNILVLEDKSIWEFLKLEKRKQTWSEWWHSKEVILDSFFLWENFHWQKGHKVVIQENTYLEDLEDSLTKNNREKLYGFPYAIENIHTKKIGIAKKINLSELIYHINNRIADAYLKGYNVGYKKGYEDAYKKFKK